MPAPVAGPDSPRSPAWKWLVCGLLLLATMLNYMDRLSLNQLADPIRQEFALSHEEYGLLETAFSAAFGVGAVLLGWLADRGSVRRLYPLVLLAWSLAGFATGFVVNYLSLLVCRFCLGLAEAGHWPCALKTTQRILPPAARTLGNGLLQSGAALGAVLTPLLVLALWSRTGSWRLPFLVVGSLGLFWVMLWLALVRDQDLALPGGPDPTAGPQQLPAASAASVPLLVPPAGSSSRLFIRRFLVLAVIVTCINLTWHFFRAWLPLFLQEKHGYAPQDMNYFVSAYYLASDLGSLTAGVAVLKLSRRHDLSAHASQVLVFAVGAGLVLLSWWVAWLPAGPGLVGVLLVIGFATLGLFPSYYSLSQELTVRHQGKLTGLLSFVTWQVTALFQWLVGREIDRSGSYALGLFLAGLAPLLALGVLLGFWGREPALAEQEAACK